MTTAPLRILLADDDALHAKVLEHLLRKQGYEVVAKLADGETAVAAVQKLRPDVAVLDVEMPVLDGLKAAARIQEVCPTPVVVLSAHSLDAMVDEAARSGVGAYLLKPVDAGALERAIELAVARHRDLMELRRLYEETTRQKQKLQKALTEIKTLQGLIPICSHCNKIREDGGAWVRLEAYIKARSAADFSHGICPDCLRKVYRIEPASEA